MFDITWLRPEWLWGLLPLAALSVYIWRASDRAGEWEALVDPALQPYVLESGASQSKIVPLMSLLFCLLALLMLAGPVWEQKDAPAFKQQQAQLVLFDLSSSMLADDLKPSRLVRARYKLLDLMQQAEGVQMGLIAFSERPYVISPLSDDASTLSAFVESLSPDIMPVGGSRADLAVAEAVTLMQQAGANAGHIVLITDTDVNSNLTQAVERANAAGYKISLMAAGTLKGAPLRDETGQFIKDKNGAVVVPRINLAAYQQLADTGDGVAVMLSDTQSDIASLQNVLSSVSGNGDASQSNTDAVNWVEYSPYLIPLLMLIVLPFFRRGAA